MTENENNRSFTPTGNKSFPTVDVSGGTEMPPGVLGVPINPNPHGHRVDETISPDARAELGKLGDAQRAGMQEYLNRK